MHNGEHPPLSRRRAHASGPSARHRQPGDQPVAYREVFAVSEFRALWSAQALSCAGDQFAQVAIAFMVYARTGSPFLTAAGVRADLPAAGARRPRPGRAGRPGPAPAGDDHPGPDPGRAGRADGPAGDAVRGVVRAVLRPPCCSARRSPSARAALLPEVLPRDKYPLGSVIGSHTAQLSQIGGFLAGGGLVAALGPYRALALDSLSFSLSAGILACGVRPRPAPPRPATAAPRPGRSPGQARPAVFGSPVLRILVLFGWLAGFTVVPEALAAPYAHTLGGGAPTIGLLMAAMPAGHGDRRVRDRPAAAALGPAAADGLAGHAVLRAADLQPGAPAAAGAVPALGPGRRGRRLPVGGGRGFRHGRCPPTRRVRAFAVAQTGLLAAQGLGILAGGAVAQRIGPPGAVALAGLLGLLAAAALATDWTRRHAELIGMLISGRSAVAVATAPARPRTGQLHRPPAPATGAPATGAPATGATPASAPAIGTPPARPPVLNLPVAERGTGLSGPAPAAGPTTATATAELSAPAGPAGPPPRPAQPHYPNASPRRPLAAVQPTGRPRDLSVRTRLAATRLLDQVLGDRRVLPFLWDDDPSGQVHQREDAGRHHGEREEDQRGPRWGRCRRTRRSRSRRQPRADLSVSGLAACSHWLRSCPDHSRSGRVQTAEHGTHTLGAGVSE